MPVKNAMLNISTFRHALNCKYMSNPSGFSFGDFNSCMVFITTGKTLSNKLPVRLPVVLHHNYWNIFGISQEVQIMKNPPNFLLAQTQEFCIRELTAEQTVYVRYCKRKRKRGRNIYKM